MENENRYRRKVIESLRLLSLDYRDQISIFPSFVNAPFEVLDTFFNAFLLLPNLIESQQFCYEGIANLLRIRFLANMIINLENFDTITDAEFEVMEDWKLINSLAKETLYFFGEEVIEPNLDFI